MKAKALARMQDPDTAGRRLHASDSLLELLNGLRLRKVRECQRQPVYKMIREFAFPGLVTTAVFSKWPLCKSCHNGRSLSPESALSVVIRRYGERRGVRGQRNRRNGRQAMRADAALIDASSSG